MSRRFRGRIICSIGSGLRVGMEEKVDVMLVFGSSFGEINGMGKIGEDIGDVRRKGIYVQRNEHP